MNRDKGSGAGRQAARRPGAHLTQVTTPDEVVWHAPNRCGGCGADMADAPVTGVQARQVFDLPPLHPGLRRSVVMSD
jgi:transposase